MGRIIRHQPFGNQLIKVDLTGQDIRDILNQQWQKGTTRMLQFQVFNYVGCKINQTVERLTKFTIYVYTNGEELSRILKRIA